jgi:hypothetical protein
MCRTIILSVVFALLVGPSAMGSTIFQDQGLLIGTVNNIGLTQGQESASSIQTMIVSIDQDTGGIGSALASASLMAVTNHFGGFTGMSGALIGQSLISSSLTSPSMHLLSDQARLHLLMFAH